MVKNSFIEKTCCGHTLELPHRGNSNVYLQHMLLKIRKKTIWKVSCPLSFKHPKLPISIKIPVTPLQIINLKNAFNFWSVHGIINTSGLFHEHSKN